MTFKSLTSNNEANSNSITEKIYIKLLAFGIRDLTSAYQIIEQFKKNSTSSENTLIDIAVYEYLSKNKISKEDFHAKHILSLTSLENKNLDHNSINMLSQLDKLFPKKNKVSSMTPNPIHFGPLEGFLSSSFSNIDLRTLVVTIGFWIIVYGLIIYYLYL